MTTLEIILLVILIYLIIGMFTFYFKPADILLIPDDKQEKGMALATILLWPIVLLHMMTEAFDDTFYF